jgi:hypothetical protein
MATTAAQEMQESFLSAIRGSQEITLQATKFWVETVEYFTPKVSYTRQLPTAHDVVASTFGFAEQMLASQRRFADDVLKATSPLMPGDGPATPPEAGSRRPGKAPEPRRNEA